MSKATKKRQSAKQQPAPQPVAMEVDDDANLSEDEEGGTRIGGIYIPPPIPPHCSTEAKGPRMIISNIHNTNFKSYAGTVDLGPFHQRFSAIIGPNGSGKSNVIDSMLFVFGYRAQKIRSKKLSVLLHNSTSHPNINSCTVAVRFVEILDKEDGGYEKIAGSEVVVARTAFRDNTSYYTINDRRVHFKEVSALLRKHGIDLDHNRFLILQGEVESISMMKPKALTDNECGLLEYLEDIIGTTRYKVPLIQINECVEKMNEERTEKHNRCKLAEREMKDLEQPKNEAVEYLKLKNSYTRTQNLQIQKYLHEQEKRSVEFQKDKDAQLEIIQKLDADSEELHKQRAEKEAFMKEEAKKYGGLEKQLEEADAQMKASLDKYAEIQANMTATNKRRKVNMAQIEKEKEKIEELKKVPEANRKEIKECEQKAEKLNKQKQEAEDQLAANYTTLKDETKTLLEQKEKLQTELIDLKKTEDEAKAELSIAESELKLCKQNETTERRKLESMRTSYEDSKNTLAEHTATLQVLEETLPGILVKLEESKAKFEANRTEEKETVQQLRKIKAKVDESVNAMQQTKSQGRVLDALMQQKNQGHIPGILGRLGDLGAIDARYDVAISTCCARLDWIVVDTVNTGQTCIEYLKKHNVGRASFITLEKVEHLTQQCQQRIQTPENVPRLFDLVRVEDNRVLPAFYYALRDTLVANDLDQGTRIGYGRQRYRVVTLGGDVIEIAGNMSGGGKSQMRGRMGQKVATKTAGNTPKSNKELEHMQRQAQELQSHVNFLQEQQGQLQRETEKLTSSSRSKENEIKRLRITIKSLSEQLPRIQDQVKKQQTKVDNTHSDPERVRELEQQVADNKTLFDKSKKAADKIQKQVDSFTTQITDITNTKVKAFQTKIAGLSKQIDKLTSNISKLTVEIAQSDRNLNKTKEKIENLEAEVTAAQDSLRKSDELRTEEGEKMLKFTAAIEQLKADLERIQGESSGVKKEIVEIQKRENEAKMKRLELEQTLSVIEKKLGDILNGIPHWKRKLAPLKLDAIPEEPEPEPLKVYTNDELEEQQLEQIQYKMTAQEEQLSTLKPNLSVIAEFNHKREAYIQSFQVLEEITQKRNEMRQLYDEVKKKRFTEFMNGFNIITKKLKEMYQMITLGGDADLELVDSMDPFNEGIVFSVRPPKKSWKMISNLSGGEKTLSSLALVFALHYYKPSPLYVMDEIDAALDFKNVSIVANYIKERTKNAQFIIISLRSNMFELSDYLVGIYKVNDCTNSVTIENQPPIENRTNRNLYNNSLATPSQPPVLEVSLQPEEEQENDRSHVQLPPTQPSQELTDVVME